MPEICMFLPRVVSKVHASNPLFVVPPNEFFRRFIAISNKNADIL